jgi:hypothetical protein
VGHCKMLARTDTQKLSRELLPMRVQQRFDSRSSCDD